MPKFRKDKNTDPEIAVGEETQTHNVSPDLNGSQTNGASLQKVGQPQATQSDGSMDTAPGPAMDTEIELIADTVSPHIAPISLNRVPNGAELRGPLLNGARTFKGTFEQAGVDREKLLEW